MTPQETYDRGRTIGYEIADITYDETEFLDEDNFVASVLSSEQNARQFSPFESFASEINSSENFAELWDKYEEGVGDGILQFIAEISTEPQI